MFVGQLWLVWWQRSSWEWGDGGWWCCLEKDDMCVCEKEREEQLSFIFCQEKGVMTVSYKPIINKYFNDLFIYLFICGISLANHISALCFLHDTQAHWSGGKFQFVSGERQKWALSAFQLFWTLSLSSSLFPEAYLQILQHRLPSLFSFRGFSGLRVGVRW